MERDPKQAEPGRILRTIRDAEDPADRSGRKCCWQQNLDRSRSTQYGSRPIVCLGIQSSQIAHDKRLVIYRFVLV